MKPTSCLVIDPIAIELARRPQGVRLSEVIAQLAVSHPDIKREAISTRLSTLGRVRGVFVPRFIAERESHGDLLTYFASEALADACPDVVKTKAETKIVAYTNVKTYGIKTLEDIRQRCWIDPETGCWVWKGCFGSNRKQKNGRAQASIAVEGGKRRTVGVGRLAWELSGNTVPEGYTVYRALCDNRKCVWHEHSGCRSQSSAIRALAKAGVFKSSVAKKAAARAMALKTATPVETVREIERMLAAGMTKRGIANVVGLCTNTILKIARKRHLHSDGTAQVLRAGSVFTFGNAKVHQRDKVKRRTSSLSKAKREALQQRLDERAAGSGPTLQTLSSEFGLSMAQLSRLSRGISGGCAQARLRKEAQAA